jgi:galactokinase
MNKTAITVQSPGRINIIGEHTDYNNGFVLPAAIDKNITFHLQKNQTKYTAHFYAKNVNQNYSFQLNDFRPIESGWENYVMGVVSELQKLGAIITGFDAEFGGNVPLGSGMSSSAALECSLAFGLNELFDLGFDKWQLVKASQMAEHHFVGTKCGIMDQFASVMGKKNQVMLLDCRSLEFEYFPLELGDYDLVLLNSNVSHSLADSEYNTRREECEIGIAIIQKVQPKVQSLRDVTLEMLEPLSLQMPLNVYKRCHHIVTENARVLAAAQAMKEGDINQLGRLMYQSHFSLQHDYKVSCKELDYLVQQTLDKDYVLGSRMMGGGFGGCTINIVRKDKKESLIQELTNNYKTAFDIDLTPYFVSVEDGAKVI